MEHSVRALMAQMIDYAGLFPPAALPLEPAIRQYAAYRSIQDRWMLGRFVIPCSQLKELSPWMTLFTDDQPLRLSVIGSKCTSAAECLDLLSRNLQEIEAFITLHRASAQIEVMELPLPPARLDSQLLDAVAAGAAKAGVQLYVEMTYVLTDYKAWKDQMDAALDEIKSYNSTSRNKLGVKLRTGGAAPGSYPTPQQVAFILVGCRDRGLALKFTAGLHHPVRLFVEEAGTKMHGYLNVFISGLLAHAHTLDIEKTAEIVADEHLGSFFLNPDRLGWRSLSLTSADVRTLRGNALTSFGCCSFDEPREELRQLMPELWSW